MTSLPPGHFGVSIFSKVTKAQNVTLCPSGWNMPGNYGPKISDESLAALTDIIEREHGVRMSPDEARDAASNLLGFFGALVEIADAQAAGRGDGGTQEWPRASLL